MATPEVAGAVALVLQAHLGANPVQVLNVLNAAAVTMNLAPGTTPLFLQTTSSGLRG